MNNEPADGGRAPWSLFLEKQKPNEQAHRKRKAKGVGEPSATSDLNNPTDGTLALVSSGLVEDPVSKMSGDVGEGKKESAELLKKQLLSQPNETTARLVVAMPGSPRRAQ